jgi:hypothetical protein
MARLVCFGLQKVSNICVSHVPPKFRLLFNCLHVVYILEDRNLQAFFVLWVISVAFVENSVSFFLLLCSQIS